MFLTLKTLLAGTLLAAALPAQTPQTDRTAECAAAGETCYGVLRVPLDWADPASERIDVRYLWLPRGDRTKPALTTVVANGGGPGPLDPAYAELSKALLGPLADRVDVLMVEPRGFGDADPTCEGLDGDRPETITACARKLGEKAGYYSTDQAAADVDAARAAVGAQNVTFVGNSYGTLLGQAYAARFPRHLRAMFLTSVVGTGDDGYDQQGFRNQAKLGLANLEAACRRSPACARENSDPAALWERLVRRLRAHPDPRVPLRRTGPLVTAAHDARTTLAAANAYLRHDPAPLRRLITRKVPVELTPALFTYYCGDARFPFDRDAAPAERLRQLDAYAEQHRVFWPYTAAETESPAADWTRRCASWPTPRQSPPVSGTFPDVPVLAIGGQFDSDTAPADAASVAARFPQGRSYTVPFGGHGQLFGFSPVSACLQDVLRAFVADPRRASIGCTAENYRLLGRFPRRAEELTVPHEELTVPHEELTVPHEGRAMPYGRLVGVAFATAADAIAPLDPDGLGAPAESEPGLRGGRIVRKDGVVTLDGVKYVQDARVSGTVRVDPGTGAASADLRVTPGGRVKLTWQPFRAEDSTQVSGTAGGVPFTVRVPAR